MKSIKVSFVQILVLLVVLGCTGQKKTDTRHNEISSIVNNLVTENEIPGLNVSIYFPDGNQENYSAGYADVKNKIKLTDQHVMFSGSIGKTYAAAIIYQLVDEGKVNLSDRILKYFPDVKWLSRVPNMEEITVAMCLQHTTGLPRYAFKAGVWELVQANPDKVWSYKDRFSFVFDDKPVHEAGKGWAYSDTNYLLLGMLIEKIEGKYYYDVVSERILKPTKLRNTFAADRRKIPNLPIGYSKLPEDLKVPEMVVKDGEYFFNPQMEWTGGGFASTTADLAMWAKYYYSADLFSDSLLLKITTPTSLSLEAENTDPYGMGSFLFNSGHGTAYGHTGFMPGFNSIFAWFPEYEIAVAMQINCDYASEKLSLLGYVDRILENVDNQ
jgi:D-alanyl-D-alanine carboxypeptidase